MFSSTTMRIRDEEEDIRPGAIIEVKPGAQCNAEIKVNWPFTKVSKCCREPEHSGAHCIVSLSGRIILVDELSKNRSPSLGSTPGYSTNVLNYCRRIAHIVGQLESDMSWAEQSVEDAKKEISSSDEFTAEEKSALIKLLNDVRIPDPYDIETPIDPEDETTWQDVLADYF